jgi:hypothetical protein
MGTLRNFETVVGSATATSGSTSGLTASSVVILDDNTTQIIVHNKSASEVLYIYCYNTNEDPGNVNLNNAFEIGAGAYLTLSLGSRSNSVGARNIAGFTTAASAFDYKVVKIFGIQD